MDRLVAVQQKPVLFGILYLVIGIVAFSHWTGISVEIGQKIARKFSRKK